MKSLEIVNNLINYMESIGETYDFTNISKEDCKQIKADLEILEILRKHLWIEDDYVCVSDYLRNAYYEEDFVKVQQWLEENENDD